VTGTIRIGTYNTQNATFIAGIYGATASSGAEVFINNNGQLGTVTSSARFKEQITDMGDSSSNLFQLRPVNFYYKPQYDDGSHLLQYGLIAEEVAKVYPEMVLYDKDGQIQTVKYQMLAPMLLNEVQKQATKIQQQAEQNQQQAEQNRQQAEQNRQQAGEIRSLQDRLTALETLLSNAPQPVR
jgi:predicted ribosome quality control (RQC) complex YloA/Tae2 family protein